MKTVFIDAGHGGINPNGRYVTSPDKMFRHSQGLFHDKQWFFEGVFNRHLSDKVCKLLFDKGIPFVKVYHEFNDTPLEVRSSIANEYHRRVNNGIYLSIHANAASNLSASGFEVFTSPGQTASDPIAEEIYQTVKRTFPTLRLRPDTSDGDHDKEAKFHVLTRTVMPSVLVECGFFTNYNEAVWLMQDNTQNLFAKAFVDSIEKFV